MNLELLKDQRWRLRNLYYIIDRNKRRRKFSPNAVQERLFDNMWFRNIIPKSRQHGITTGIDIWILDQCLFYPNIRAGVIAHNDEDARAIFQDKIKFPYDNLPAEIRALRKAETDRKQELRFSNNSSIRVIPSGRSGTYNILHVSEFGKICVKRPDHADEIVAGSFEAVHAGNYIFIESTAHGRIGRFFDMCQRAKALKDRGLTLNDMDFKLFFFGWHENPENRMRSSESVIPQRIADYAATLKQQHGILLDQEQIAWYAAKDRDLGPLMKSEHPSTFEECFEKTIEGSYYASQFMYLRTNHRITAVPYIDGASVDTWWDLGMNDTNCIVFTQDIGREIHVIDYYENSGEGLGHYRDVLYKKGYRYGRHVGPHDLSVRELGSGKSRLETAASLGIRFEVAPMMPVLDGIESVRKLLSICWFDEKKCEKLLTHLEHYRKEWDDRLGAYKSSPLHDEHSHGADAFRTLAVKHGIIAPGIRSRIESPSSPRARIVV